MSNQIVLPNGPTGRVAGTAGGFYAIVYNLAGDVWNGSSFQAINLVTWANADIPMTEQGTTGQYRVAMPGAITRQAVAIEVREQFSSTPHVVNDLAVGRFGAYWDGTNLRDTVNGPLAAQSYAADGVEPDLAQVLYMIYSMRQAVVSGTSFLVKGLDGTTTVMTWTLDDADNPTQMIRTA